MLTRPWAEARRIARRPVVQHAGLLWAANLAVTVIGILTSLMFVRLAAPEDYGRFSFVAAVLAVASVVTMPGLDLSTTQAAAKHLDGMLALALSIRLRWSLPAVLGVLALAGWYFPTDGRTAMMLLVSAPLIPLAFSFDVGQAFVNGRQRYTAVAGLMLLLALLPMLGAGAALVAGSSMVIVCGVYFAGQGCANLVGYLSARRLVENDRSDKDILRFGRRASFLWSLGSVQFYIDKIAVGSVLGFQELAIYSAAKLFQQGLKAAWGALYQLLLPKLAMREVGQARAMIMDTLLPTWGIFIAMSVAAAVLVGPVVHLLFGARYAASVPIARVMIFAIAVGIPGAQFEVLFRATSDERRLYTQRIIFSVVQVGATAGGAVFAGVKGAAWGTLAAYGLNSMVGYGLLRWAGDTD